MLVTGRATVLLCDFNAAHSINITGNGKIMFRSVFKLALTDTPGNLEITTASLDNGEVVCACNTTVNAIVAWVPISGVLLPDLY